MKTRAIPLLLLTLLLSLTACVPLQATVTFSGASPAHTESTQTTNNRVEQSNPEAINTQETNPPQSSPAGPTTIDADLLAALESAQLDLSQVGKELAHVQLKGGVWEGKPYQAGGASRPMVHLYTDDTGQPVAALGDLTGDGANELAAVVAVETGGSGTFMQLVVLAVSDGPQLKQLATADLGDRTKIEQITMADGQVAVAALVVGENDPMCCPNTAQTLRFAWIDGALQPASDEATGPEGATPGDGEHIAYEDLLAKATIQHGLFTIYQVENSWYLEIPTDLLGRDFYWYSELSEVSPLLGSMGVGLGAIGEKMITFEQVGQRVMVNELSSVAGKRGAPTEDGSLDLAVAESALPSVLLTLPIVSESPDGALVVDLGTPLQTDLNEFSVASLLGGSASVDPDRSFVQHMDAYPNNIGVSTLLTFLVTPSFPGFDEFSVTLPATSESVLVRHNITLLPETPMTSRYADPRVGYFTISYEDYSGARNPDVEDRELITRFRLEKKDPSAKLSEPMQPIVFYISREVPLRWRTYIKQGIEDWQPAFAAAGFKNAIIAKDAPSPAEDPTWDPSDTRYSVIRWVAQPVANAMGPSTVDPRSGEILSAHVQLFADLPELVEQWYFAQASAVDEAARTLPLSDALLGKLIRQVVAHEVGHTLGLRHNHKASQAFTIAQLRDPAFTKEHGDNASLMSYGRYNYVAQPGDGVTNLIPVLGPYDIFAIQWGYQPIPDAQSPEDERKTLDEWAARQIDEPWLRFGGEDEPAMVDPNVLTENIGDDRVEATRLGLQNLERVMGYLLSSTTSLGSDFNLLQKSYSTVLDLRYNWLSSVVKLIGGVEEARTLAGRGDVQFKRVPKDKQQAALQFVLTNLQTPTVFMPAAILDRLTPTGGADTLQQAQQELLTELLDSSRLQRLVEGEQLGTDAYLLVDYLAELQDGLFAELKQDAPQIDPMRRALQRSYLETLQGQMTPGSNSDLRAAARWNLQKLLATIKGAEAKSSDATISAHLADLQNQVETILEGPSQPGQTGM